MTLRLRRLRMRAKTPEGLYGATIPFGHGLTAVWADNTKGKSTCTQGMLYVLGLERMLGPRRQIPLPHAMTSYLLADVISLLGMLGQPQERMVFIVFWRIS